MRRLISLVMVAAIMAAMIAVMANAAVADPPAGAGAPGCQQGLNNAYFSIGTGEASGESRAPYKEQPIGEPGQGQGPSQGFDTSEGNTVEHSLDCIHVS